MVDLGEIARRNATCPFLGPAVAGGDLLVTLSPDGAPTAAIADVVRLGNTGGGDLGWVLRLFASGNHARAPDGKAAPDGAFSLDLPGSQGSHAGHSGILQADPLQPGSGRFDEAAFARLIAPARDGLIARSDVGRFIAGNIRRDPASRVLGLRLSLTFAANFVPLLGLALAMPFDRTAGRRFDIRLTRVLGADNLIGAAGEFGLLFAFFQHRPDPTTLEGEPALRVDDLTLMFRDHRFPTGWETWPKRRIGWITNTTALFRDAGQAWRAAGRAT